MRAFLHLFTRHLHARVPVGLEHRVAELPGAVRVRPFTDGEVRELLVERHVRVDRRAAGLELGRAHDRRTSPPSRSTTARRCSGVVPQQPPTTLSPNSRDEAFVRLRQHLGREVVVRVPVDDRRQPRVRAARRGTCARAARDSAGARSSRPGPSRSSSDDVGLASSGEPRVYQQPPAPSSQQSPPSQMLAMFWPCFCSARSFPSAHHIAVDTTIVITPVSTRIFSSSINPSLTNMIRFRSLLPHDDGSLTAEPSRTGSHR